MSGPTLGLMRRVATQKVTSDPHLVDIVKRILEPAQQKARWPAISGGVTFGNVDETEDGTPAVSGVWTNGVASAAQPSRAVSHDAPFHLGSVGKSFTATAAQVLVERGNLSLFSPVADVWRDAVGKLKANPNAAVAANPRVLQLAQEMTTILATVFPNATVADLLDHRSGLSDQMDIYGLSTGTFSGLARIIGMIIRNGKDVFSSAQELWRPFHELVGTTGGGPGAEAMTLDQLLRTRHEPLQRVFSALTADPSRVIANYDKKSWAYSNFAYGLAAATMEAATGFEKSYETIVREAVFDPLGLHSAGFGEPAEVLGTGSVFRRPGGNANASSATHVVAPVGHRYKGFFAPTFKYLPVAAPKYADQSFIPPAIRAAGDIFCSTDDWLTMLRFHLANAQQIEADAAAKSASDAAGDDAAALSAVLSRTSMYYPRNPEVRPGVNYRSGFLLNAAAEISADGRGGQQDGAKVSFPYHLSHDGSSGCWYAFFVVVPEWDVAACAVANCAPLHMPAVLVPAVKRMAIEAYRHATRE